MNSDSTERKFVDLDSKLIESSTKNKILEIAVDFFSRKGYTGVSIRDITGEVGIKESSLYKHFKNKEEILQTIFFNFRKELAKIFLPTHQLDYILQSMTPRAFLERGLLNFMEHINDPLMQKIWRIVSIEQYRDEMARDIYLNDILGNTVQFLEKAFGKMEALKKIRPLDPKTLAVEYQYPIFTMINEYNILKFEKMDTTDVERKMLAHIDFFSQLIAP